MLFSNGSKSAHESCICLKVNLLHLPVRGILWTCPSYSVPQQDCHQNLMLVINSSLSQAIITIILQFQHQITTTITIIMPPSVVEVLRKYHRKFEDTRVHAATGASSTSTHYVAYEGHSIFLEKPQSDLTCASARDLSEQWQRLLMRSIAKLC